MTGVFAVPLLFLFALLGITEAEPQRFSDVTVYVRYGAPDGGGYYGLACDPAMASPLCRTSERRIDLWLGAYTSPAKLRNIIVHEAEHLRHPEPAAGLDDPYARYREADAYAAGCSASWVEDCDPWMQEALRRSGCSEGSPLAEPERCARYRSLAVRPVEGVSR